MHKIFLINQYRIIYILNQSNFVSVFFQILSLNRCALENNISENTINLVSNDAVLIGDVGYEAQGFLFVAVDIVVALFFLWYLVAWQALVGVGFLVLVSVYGSLAASKSGRIRKKVAAQTDKRLEIMKEIVSGIRVVKMYAWERNFRDLVAQIRRFVHKHFLCCYCCLFFSFFSCIKDKLVVGSRLYPSPITLTSNPDEFLQFSSKYRAINKTVQPSCTRIIGLYFKFQFLTSLQ